MDFTDCCIHGPTKQSEKAQTHQNNDIRRKCIVSIGKLAKP